MFGPQDGVGWKWPNSAHASSPARQDNRLSALARLPSDASHVWEVCTPLPAVEAILPELPHSNTLAPMTDAASACMYIIVAES